MFRSVNTKSLMLKGEDIYKTPGAGYTNERISKYIFVSVQQKSQKTGKNETEMLRLVKIQKLVLKS